jgi:DNA-binding NarL/FixJ family response regulator
MGTGMTMDPVHIYFVYGYRLLTEAMARRLEGHREVCLVGKAAHLDTALEEIPHLAIDLVLLDASGGHEQALLFHRELRRALPDLKILPLGLPDEQTVLGFLEAGASGYVLHDQSFEELMRILLAVHRDRPPCSSRVAACVCARIAELADQRAQRQDHGMDLGLTPREVQVLRLVAENLRNQEIAGRLEIALATVKNHVHNILAKLQVNGRREAIRRAYESGLLALHEP